MTDGDKDEKNKQKNKTTKNQPSLRILFQRHMFRFSGKASFAVSPYTALTLCYVHVWISRVIEGHRKLICTWSRFNDCIKTQSSVISCIASLVMMILGIGSQWMDGFKHSSDCLHNPRTTRSSSLASVHLFTTTIVPLLIHSIPIKAHVPIRCLHMHTNVNQHFRIFYWNWDCHLPLHLLCKHSPTELPTLILAVERQRRWSSQRVLLYLFVAFLRLVKVHWLGKKKKHSQV